KGTFSQTDRWLELQRGSQLLLWDLKGVSASLQPMVLKGHDHEISLNEFVAGGEMLVTASFLGNEQVEPRLWNLADRSGLRMPRLVHTEGDSTVDGAFSPNAAWFVEVGNTTVTLWSLENGRERHFVYSSLSRYQYKPIFSADSRWVLISEYDHKH